MAQGAEGFTVGLYATGLTNPRILRRAPNGDMFLAETTAGDIKIFRGMTKDGKPKEVHVFATGLNTPFGIAFYPLGPDPKWVYVANMNSVVRFPYHNGDLAATGPAEHLDDLPSGGHHRSRDVQFSPDGKTMFVSVGSQENVDDTPAEKDRADILAFDPDGSNKRVYAYGIRNPVGIAVNPKTGELWCSVMNERDELGRNLVPDYITHVQPGGFYGWPWWYMGPHQDPRVPGTTPGPEGQSHHARRDPAAAQRVAGDDVLRRERNFRLSMPATFSLPNTGRGTGRPGQGYEVDSRAPAPDGPRNGRVRGFPDRLCGR